MRNFFAILIIILIIVKMNLISVYSFSNNNFKVIIHIGKYGDLDINITSLSTPKPPSLIRIVVDFKNASYLRFYTGKLRSVILNIIVKNYTNNIILGISGSSIIWASFRSNLFETLNATIITDLQEGNPVCLQRKIDLLTVLESSHLIRVLKSVSDKIYVKIDYGFPELEGKIYELPGNGTVLRSIDAIFLLSRLGLPRVSLRPNHDLLGILDLGDTLRLRLAYLNMTSYFEFLERGNASQRDYHIEVPGIVVVEIPYFRPLSVQSILTPLNISSLKLLNLSYVNNIGIAIFYFNASTTDKYEVFLDFMPLKSGNHTIRVIEKFFPENHEPVVLRRYAFVVSPTSECGVIKVYPIPVHRTGRMSFWYFAVVGLLILIAIIIYMLWYRVH